MADDEDKKTETVGYVEVKNLKTWDDYKAKAMAFAAAKVPAEKAKKAIRAAIKQGLRLEPDDDIDFTADGELEKAHRVRVIRNLKKKGRTKAKNLEFHPQ